MTKVVLIYSDSLEYLNPLRKNLSKNNRVRQLLKEKEELPKEM